MVDLAAQAEERLMGEMISDIKNYIQSRRKKGKSAKEIQADLEREGYDLHGARGLIMLHWEYDCDNPECPQGGHCDGKCAKNF